MNRRTFIATSLATSLGMVFQAKAHAATKWDLASGYPAFNFHSINLDQFAKDIDAATNGDLKITTHPGASLFKMPEIKRAVQGNQIQAGEFFMVSFQNEWQPFGLDGLPFLCSNYEEAFKLYQAQRPALEKKLDEQGMVLLYAVAWPPQSIYSNKPIHSIDDLKGLKWRVYSPTTARIGELVGAQPVTIQEAELTQALATGVIEGLITSSATGADNKLYEQMKYFTNVRAWIPKNVIVANKKAFDALSDDTRKAVMDAAAEAEKRGWEASRKVDEDSIAKLKEGGMNVEEPTEELREELAKVGNTVIEEWVEKAGDEGKKILDDYRASL